MRGRRSTAKGIAPGRKRRMPTDKDSPAQGFVVLRGAFSRPRDAAYSNLVPQLGQNLGGLAGSSGV